MKLIMTLILVLISSESFSKSRDEIEAEKTEARNAKAICLMNDNLMRGKRLKECMDQEIAKNRKSDLRAKLKARKLP